MNKKNITSIIAATMGLASIISSCNPPHELPSNHEYFQGKAYFTGFSIQEDTISKIHFSLKNNEEYSFTLSPTKKSVPYYLKKLQHANVSFEAKPLKDTLSYAVIEEYFSIK
ncbi:MAG: hypothetical protein ACOCQQ_01395 [Candidatus Nanoarchaeia archaeon]